jgi:hypothetical protein
MPPKTEVLIERLAEKHLGDSNGSPENLLRRIDKLIEQRDGEIEQLRKKESVAASMAEKLREVVSSSSPATIKTPLQEGAR